MEFFLQGNMLLKLKWFKSKKGSQFILGAFFFVTKSYNLLNKLNYQSLHIQEGFLWWSTKIKNAEPISSLSESVSLMVLKTSKASWV